MKAEHLFFYDAETTGLYPERHAIIQHAAVKTDLKFNVIAYFQTLVRPFDGAEIDDIALSVSGRTREELEKAPRGWEAASALWEFASLYGSEKPRFAGFNCKFDLGMLAAEWKRYGMLPPYSVPWLCGMETARQKFPVLPKQTCDKPYCDPCRGHTHRLVDVCQHLGIKIKAHDAMGDLKGTITALKLMLKEVEPIEAHEE